MDLTVTVKTVKLTKAVLRQLNTVDHLNLTQYEAAKLISPPNGIVTGGCRKS